MRLFLGFWQQDFCFTREHCLKIIPKIQIIWKCFFGKKSNGTFQYNFQPLCIKIRFFKFTVKKEFRMSSLLQHLLFQSYRFSSVADRNFTQSRLCRLQCVFFRSCWLVLQSLKFFLMIGKTHNNGAAHSIKKTVFFVMMIFFSLCFNFCFQFFTRFFDDKTNNIIMFVCKCVCRFFVNPCCSKENRTCKFFIFWKKACHAR